MTNFEDVLEHPFEVPVTVYVVLLVGDTVQAAVEGPPVQTYVEAPLAVKVAEAPVQIVLVPEIDTVGNALTVTNCEAVFVQPFAAVPVTVYVVFVDGDTV